MPSSVRSLSNPKGWPNATPLSSTDAKGIAANKKIALALTLEHLLGGRRKKVELLSRDQGCGEIIVDVPRMALPPYGISFLYGALREHAYSAISGWGWRPPRLAQRELHVGSSFGQQGAELKLGRLCSFEL
jgi:hypothetical protein